MLEKLKTLLGISDNDKDLLLEVLISQSTEYYRDFTHSDVDCEPLIMELAIFRYNRIGTEGLNSESYSGVTFNYSDLPESLMRQLISHRKIRVVR